MTPNPYILAAEDPSTLLTLLRSNPSLAAGQDEHGYSLLHAASSYGHIDLLHALVRDFKVDVNLTDEDGDTCLFVAESLDIARCLVEELEIDLTIKNNGGLTAQEAIDQDGSFPEVAAYLGEVNGNAPSGSGTAKEPLRKSHSSPSLPPNVSIRMETVPETETNGGTLDVDPEFQRRIEELAASEDFHNEAGQNRLRALITDAIKDIGTVTEQRYLRRRLE
jgi:uncharacterized protein